MGRSSVEAYVEKIVPGGVKIHQRGLERRLRRIVLVAHFQYANIANGVRAEGEVVLALRRLVHVLDGHVDRLPGIALFEVDGTDEVGVSPYLRRLECAGEDVG